MLVVHVLKFKMIHIRRILLKYDSNILSIRDSSSLSTIKVIKENSHLKSNEKERKLPPGPGLKEFIAGIPLHGKNSYEISEDIPYLNHVQNYGFKRKVFIDVYGCQMNVNDTEIVWSILQTAGFNKADNIKDADVILLMTCAIRENAETKIWNRLEHLKAMKSTRSNTRKKPPLKIGILGCMAERLKQQLVERERAIDVVAGPDSYKDLPRLLALTENNQTAVNVLLSQDETYADVIPVRLNKDSVTAFVSIMRGCDNMCTYCIVPFTRGRERSRPVSSILEEVRQLSEQGIKEITLLGQNVNSYRDLSEGLGEKEETKLVPGFKTVYRSKKGGLRFASLLEQVAAVDPQMRIRFTSPHPKDFPDEVLDVLSSKPNVCLSLHLPAQSGSSSVLERMRRGYTRDSYLRLIDHVCTRLPGVTLSSDFICGFCGETDSEFEETITLMEKVQYQIAYLFAYSMREKTTAHRKFIDDVPEDVKKDRLKRMVEIFRRNAAEVNRKLIGFEQTVLIESVSKRSEDYLAGRNDGNIKVILPQTEIPVAENCTSRKFMKPGDYVSVKITDCNSQVLKGVPLHHTSLS